MCARLFNLRPLLMLEYVETRRKIDIDIPKLNVFIHKTYINIARKLYKNIYLFDQDSSPLQKQKNNREFEIIIRECIVDTIRSSIPTDRILRAYMSEKMEEEIEEETQKEEVKKELAPIKTDSVETIKNEENTKKDESSTPLPKKEDIVVPAVFTRTMAEKRRQFLS